MNNRQVTYDNYTIGAKVALNEEGKKHMSSTYHVSLFTNVIYGIIIKHDDHIMVVVDWYNHKGMKELSHRYVHMKHMEYYEQ